jgi:hypothetical protein
MPTLKNWKISYFNGLKPGVREIYYLVETREQVPPFTSRFRLENEASFHA